MERNINKDLKLRQLDDEKLTKIHKEDLGLKIPEDYFSQSKNEILNKLTKKKETRGFHFYRKRAVLTIAAAMALFFSLKIYKQYSYSKMNQIPMTVSDTIDRLEGGSSFSTLSDTNSKEGEDNLNTNKLMIKEGDILVKSLFIEDSEIDQFIINYMLEDL
ncbi:hypothetical protein [Flavobacterium granuli]|uniref:Uncharacterized protein n=1 Tax=Flavobacterium granuli TaxID=280093 RepID=A0A1M5NV57_9FLAO|nr:hypothetical protein [Flavobacterium granuli]PRZ23410.1 hypothetical protein BC624_105132 [Flavobacterium granuli]SHG93464.1 hypothetical protein SAMN05443373_105132 [Flavobacterium granuli]